MANIDTTRDAQEELRTRFLAAGSPGGEFRPRTRPSKAGEGWHELVCVDVGERVITGIKAVRFRPVITSATAVRPLQPVG